MNLLMSKSEATIKAMSETFLNISLNNIAVL